MNNNRNNRRRGRGNRNQGGNGAQLNRIDSRARGNAPQMLDKYKKLAQDAHHNGDRVQMEYYLQFADHYFRVIADNRARQDEARGPRRFDDREQAEDYVDDDLEFDRSRRSERFQRPQELEEGETYAAADVEEGEPGQEGERFAADDRHDERPAERDDNRQRGQRRQQRKPRDSGRDENRAERDGNRSEREDQREDQGERAEKRAARPERGDKPARRGRPRKSADDDGRAVIDSAILPPSIRGDDSGPGESGGALETVD